eukprot:COSAG06_NODE_30033_length_546_cov_0.476510_1_plen_87_part_01
MDGLKQTNWMQDTILEEMQVGRTGNEVLASFDARMKAEGIDGKMYSHAIGDHGHRRTAPIRQTTEVQANHLAEAEGRSRVRSGFTGD